VHSRCHDYWRVPADLLPINAETAEFAEPIGCIFGGLCGLCVLVVMGDHRRHGSDFRSGPRADRWRLWRVARPGEQSRSRAARRALGISTVLARQDHNMPGIASAATAVVIGRVAGGTSSARRSSTTPRAFTRTSFSRRCVGRP